MGTNEKRHQHFSTESCILSGCRWSMGSGFVFLRRSEVYACRLMSIKAEPILPFEKKDTSRKGAKGAKFGKDILTADLRRLTHIIHFPLFFHTGKRP